MKQLLNRLTTRITNAGTTLRALPFVLFFMASMANNAFATDITARFPDANFLAAVRTALGKGVSDPIEDTDNFAGVTSLDVSYRGITTLAGIQHFIALQELYCNNNALTTLDVSGLANLEELNCTFNSLTALNVSGLDALRTLYCYQNALTTLDVSTPANLSQLDCSSNALTALDVAGLTNLGSLGCSNNALTALDVAGLTGLWNLECSNNSLTALDVAGLTNLQKLYCDNNSLTALDVAGLNALEILNCSNNSLTALDVAGLNALDELECYNNSLTALDVSGLTALRNFFCENNSLTALDVAGLTNLQYFDCANNLLTALDLSGLTALYYFRCYNNLLTALDVSGQAALSYFDCHNNRLTDGTQDITGCTSLYFLNCTYNDMTSVSSIMGYPAINPATLHFVPQNASGFRPVNSITGIPGSIAAGTSFDLSAVAQVRPADATYQTIVWSIYADYGTSAMLSGDILTTTATGDLFLRATITDGLASGADYVQDFLINVVPSITPVGSLTVAPIPAQVYTGSAIRPAPEVKNGSTTLVAGTDYTVTYANNINIGTATVTITGLNGYSGTLSATFAIVAELPAIAAFGQPLTPDGGTGTPSDPYTVATTAPFDAQTLRPSDITVTNDTSATVALYADSGFTQLLPGIDFYPGDTITVYVKILSGGTDFCYVLLTVSPQPVSCTVKLPSVAGFTTDPPAGAHSVPSGTDFTFRLTSAAPTPAGLRLEVITNRLLLPDAEGLLITPNEDGSYTVTLFHVQEDTEISIGYTLSAASIPAAKVWASGHTLYIHATQSGTARIYGVTGQLVTTLPLTPDETAQTTLPQGVYIVVANGRTYKIEN
jgi:Leucine-rich repeat (LRR) protein